MVKRMNARSAPIVQTMDLLRPPQLFEALPESGPLSRSGRAAGAALSTAARKLIALGDAADRTLREEQAGPALLRNALAAALHTAPASSSLDPSHFSFASGVLALGPDIDATEECRHNLVGRLRLLQAAHALDRMEGFRDARHTDAADRLTRSSLADLRVAPRGAVGSRGGSGAESGRGLRGGFVQGGGRRPWPDSGGLGGRPPESPDAPFGPPQPQPAPPTFCEQLADLLGRTFVEWAAGADADPFADLIGAVEPSCIAHDAVAATTFTATPAAGKSFGQTRPDFVRLLLGDLDLTGEILSWLPHAIEFKVPADARSASLFLQGRLPTRSGLSPSALGRILDLGANLTGISLRTGVGVPLGIVYPLELTAFMVNGTDAGVGAIEVEACRDALRLSWQLNMMDQPYVPIPRCAELRVRLVRDGADVLFAGAAPAGVASVPPRDAGVEEIELAAVILVHGVQIGAAVRRKLIVRRTRRTSLAMRVPSVPRLIGSQHGLIRLTVSCAAPAERIVVELTSSKPALLSVANRVTIPVGETTVETTVYSHVGQTGDVIITATAPGHANGTLAIDVLAPHTALVLSGGGAKGDFEAGACSYLLRHEWIELQVNSVIGTSVGSINAIGVAHGGDLQSAHQIEDAWFSLVRGSDMYRWARWVTDIKAETGVDLGGMLLGLVGEGGGAGGISLSDLDTWDGVLQIPIVGNVVGAVAGLVGASSIGDVLEAIVMFGDYLAGDGRDEDGRLVAASSVFTLAPTRERLRNSMNVQRLRASGLKLRLCMISLDDGAIYYVDERGHLLKNATGQEFDEPLTGFGYAPDYALQSGDVADRIVAGSMASSAIPAFLDAVRLSTARGAQTMVDGGVREVLPTAAAMDLGARLIVCVATGKAVVHPPSSPYTDRSHLIDIAFRSIDIQGTEVSQQDRTQPLLSCRGDLELVIIEPTGEIHGTFDINPVLIRISFAYGYMRAFDEFLHRRAPEDYDSSYASTEAIKEKRLEVFRVESDLLFDMLRSGRPGFASPVRGNPPGTGEAVRLTADELARIRNLKMDLFALVYDRFATFGPESLPKSFGTPGFVRSERIFDWWEEWEHLDGRSFNPDPYLVSPSGYSFSHMVFSGRPFDRQPVWDPTTRRAQLEATVPIAPAVPQDFVLAMTY